MTWGGRGFYSLGEGSNDPGGNMNGEGMVCIGNYNLEEHEKLEKRLIRLGSRTMSTPDKSNRCFDLYCEAFCHLTSSAVYPH